jgi:hypothetical protein
LHLGQFWQYGWLSSESYLAGCYQSGHDRGDEFARDATHPYDEGLFYNAGVLYDLPYTMLGNFNPDPNDDSCKVYTYDTKGDQFAYFKLAVSNEGRLVGAMLLGRQRRTNILRKIMEGNFIVTGHEHELMDTKFKPKDLPVADIQAAGDADVEAKLAAYASKG